MSKLPTPVTPNAEADAPPLTVGALLGDAVRTHRGTALRTAGHPHGVSFEELEVAGSEIAGGLADLGVVPGDRVAILANTRQEWTLADVGALWASAVVVPVYHTSSAEETEYVLAHSGARVVFCEDAAQLAKVDSIRERCPQLEHRVLLCGSAPHAMTLAALRARGRGVDAELLAERAAAVGPDDVATLVYTSGTTGPPKGCMLTHANLLATVEMYRVRLDLRGDMSVYLFLPLAHALARVTQLVALAVGGTIVFWRGDPQRIVDELAEVAPTHFPSVPRVFEKVHRAVVGAVEDQHRLRRLVFAWAIGEGARARARERTGRRAGPLTRRRHALADRLVLSKVRGAFGDGLRVALTGAAPIGREILEFFDACGVLVLEGYGLTETCAAATLNTEGEHRFGTVGRPLPGNEVRFLDDGELLLRGPQVFRGYYRDEEATAAVLDDGWLATGDLGMVDADGFVRITGRKKDLIITSNGKNVSPSNIEELLRETRWISQAVVFGDNRPYLVALLTLDPDEAARLAEHVGAPSSDVAELSRDPRVRAALQADVDAVNERLARIEQIKRFKVLDHDLTQSSGELTPTLKIKRPVLHEHYGDRVEELYAAAKAKATD
jgi:long-chain acyl-CoA synthetase